MLKRFKAFMDWTFVPCCAFAAIYHAVAGNAWYAMLWGFFFGVFLGEWTDKVVDLYIKRKTRGVY